MALKDYAAIAGIAGLLFGISYFPDSKEAAVPVYDRGGKLVSREENGERKFEMRRGRTSAFVNEEEFQQIFGKTPSELEKLADSVALMR